MTISSPVSTAGPFAPNGTGPYPFAFKIFDTADVLVTKYTADVPPVEVALTEDADYTVSMNADQNNDPGGTVTLAEEITGDEGLFIERAILAIQETDIQNAGGFFPEVVENAFDRVTMLCQQLSAELATCVRISVFSDVDPADLIAGIDNATDLAEAAQIAAEAATAAAEAAQTAAEEAAAEAALHIGEPNTASNIGQGGSDIGLFSAKNVVDLEFKSLRAGSNISLTEDTGAVVISSVDTGEANTASNVGAGAQAFKGKTGVDLAFRTLVAGGNVSLTQNTNDITIAATGEANTASNVGSGAGAVFKQKTGSDLELKTIKAGVNITVTNNASDITIDASGTAGEVNTASNQGAGGAVFKQKTGVDLELRSLVAGTGVDVTQNADDLTLTATGTGSNLGGGEGVFSAKSGADLEFKTLTQGAGITLTGSATEIEVATTAQANTASNVGTGAQAFKQKTGVDLEFRSFTAGSGIGLTQNADDIVISTSGGGAANSEVNVVTDFGAVADFVSGPGSTKVSGTDNSTAFDSAIATGRPVYVPAGNYWIASSTTRYNLQFTSTYGPGVLWGDTNVGYTRLGKTLPIGTNRSHEMGSVGGLHIGAEHGGFGMRQWMGHHNWMQFQPARYGAPAQVQIYPSCVAITATQASPNILVPGAGFSFDTTELFVGDYIGYNGGLYVIATLSPSSMTVTKAFVGGSPGFSTSAVERAFYKAYETSRGTCNTNGTAVTFVSGEQYPFGYSGDHMYAFINGVKYTVTQGPETVGANSLTLAATAGVQNGVSITFYRQYAPWSYVSLLRLQGVAGSNETVGVFSINLKNQLLIGAAATSYNLVPDLRIESKKIRIGGGEVYPYDDSASRYGIEVVNPMDNLAFGAHYVNVGGFGGNQAAQFNVWPAYVNYWKFWGAPTGNDLVLDAEGSDATVSSIFRTKGSAGTFTFSSGGPSNFYHAFRIRPVAGAECNLFAQPATAAGGLWAKLGVDSIYGFANLSLEPRGTGVARIKAEGSPNHFEFWSGASGYAPVIAARGAAGIPDFGFDMAGYGTYNFTAGSFAKSAFQIYCNNAPDFPTVATGTGVATFGANGASGSVDLYLAPKAGYVRFGGFTGSGDSAISGYITVKDSGGTLRKLAVIA